MCVCVCVVVVGVRTEDMCTKARGRPICVCAALAPLRRVTGVKYINASAPIPLIIIRHISSELPLTQTTTDVRSSPMAYPAVRCLNSRYTLYGAQETRAPYLFKFDYNACSAAEATSPSTKSCAIALRSPASERPSDLKRYSPGIHNPRHASSYIPHIPHHIPPSHATPSQLSNIYPLQPINESGRHQEKGTDGHSAGAWA